MVSSTKSRLILSPQTSCDSSSLLGRKHSLMTHHAAKGVFNEIESAFKVISQKHSFLIFKLRCFEFLETFEKFLQSYRILGRGSSLRMEGIKTSWCKNAKDRIYQSLNVEEKPIEQLFRGILKEATIERKVSVRSQEKPCGSWKWN